MSQVLAQDYLIDEVLYSVYEDCWKYGAELFCQGTMPSCEHASTLAACASVSRQWANLAIRHLWGRYGTYDQLVNLVRPGKVPKDEDDASAWTTCAPLNQQERFKHYAKFIKELVLDGETDFVERYLPILECGAALKDRPLFPRLKSLEMKVGLAEIPGAQALTHLLSTSVKSLYLEFYYLPKSSLRRRYLDVITCEATQLTQLTIRCVGESGSSIANHPNPDRDSFLGFQWESIRELRALKSLTIEPKFVTLDLLDAIGTLPQLSRLVMMPCLATDPEVDPVAFLQHGHVLPRQGLFHSLKELEIETEVNDLSSFLSTYLSTPHATTLDTVKITCSVPESPDKFTLPDEVARTIRRLVIQFTGPSHLKLCALEGVAKCERLTVLSVTYHSYLSVSKPDARLLNDWRSLTTLVLTTTTRASRTGYEAHEFARLKGNSKLNISCLSLFAKELPLLYYLLICPLACDTSRLEDETTLRPFPHLGVLHFGLCSFVNYELKTFKEHDAAVYITALLPENSSVGLGLPAFDDAEDDEWVEFEERYTQWLISFNQRLSDYKKVRRSQMSLVRMQAVA